MLWASKNLNDPSTIIDNGKPDKIKQTRTEYLKRIKKVKMKALLYLAKGFKESCIGARSVV